MARSVAQLPTGRRRLLLLIGIAVLFVLVLFTALSGFYVDLLWYREVGLARVFWTALRTKFALGLLFGLVFFGLLYVNLVIVRRLKPSFRALTAEAEIVERYRAQIEPSLRWGLPLVAGVLALFVGVGASARWQEFLLWRNSDGVAFGVLDPLFKRDPAFYIFSLPWMKFVQGWMFSSLVGVTLLVGIGHYLWGGIRPQAPAFADKVTPQVKAHLSVLLGLIVLVKAWGYYLGRFDLLVSPRGVVTGASYTDIKAQLPALQLLTVIAIVCAVLFLANIRLKGWALPVIGVGLLALVSVVAGFLIPSAVQRFSVAPQELQRERPYIEDNIAFTRRAFGLTPGEDISVQDRPVESEVTPKDIDDNEATVSNIRLWRQSILKQNYESLQRIRQYYEFTDVDVDRYTIGAERRVEMISIREVNQNGIGTGGTTWQNRHLVYTHGYGAVASLVNGASTEGAPLFTLKDIPPEGEPSLQAQPRVYYGEGSGAVAFVVTGTGAEELDYQGGETPDSQVTTTYEGVGGIEMGSFFRRAVFAYHFRDVNLLISGLIERDSRIMINRDLGERVPKPVPFLQFDNDPYAAVIDGRVQWIWDAYTTSSAYPYSELIEVGAALGAATGGEHTISGSLNYVRNSVKVVTDAYDGTMTYYADTANDPIIRVWDRAFPDLFTPIEEAAPSVSEHFRYPENLFQIQAEQFANYHVEDPEVFYGKQDFWQVPGDPTAPTGGTRPRLLPYYVLMKLPGEAEERFVLILPFTPQGRQNMVAWLAAESDPGSYGQLVAYRFPVGRNVEGPSQVFSRINQDERFSAERTLLSQSGSDVLFGDFLVIPIADAMLYVQPVYVRAHQENAIPELKTILVVNGPRVGKGSTLEEALTDSFVGQVAEETGGGKPPEGNVEERIAQLIAEALARFQAADEALQAGDLATYEQEINGAQELIAEADDLARELRAGGGGQAEPGGEPTATTSATPTAVSSPTP